MLMYRLLNDGSKHEEELQPNSRFKVRKLQITRHLSTPKYKEFSFLNYFDNIRKMFDICTKLQFSDFFKNSQIS